MRGRRAGADPRRRRYRHNEDGIRALCARLVRLGVALVALERPDGLLIERLLDAGLSVVAVHPNQVKASRPRYSIAGGKSDSFDSFVLAELARTDSHRFRVLVPDSDQTKALRSMTRARESLVRTRVGLANQLRDQLACFWPGASKVFCAVDSQIALAFLRRYPTPLDARGLGEQRLAAFLNATVTPAASPPASCSLVCEPGQRDAPASSSWSLGDRSSWRSSLRWSRSSPGSASSRSRSATRWTRTPTGGRSARCSSLRTRGCAPPRCSLRSATAASATPPPHARRRRRPSPRGGRVRQSQTRPVPMGVRPPTPRRVRQARRLKPPPQPLGRRHLRPRPR